LLEFYTPDDDLFQPFDPSKKRTQAAIRPKRYRAAEKADRMKNVPPSLSEKRQNELDWSYLQLPRAVVEVEEKDQHGTVQKVEKEIQLKTEEGKEDCFVINYHSDGKPFRVTKGAPQIILNMIEPEERKKIEDEFNASVVNLGAKGIRSLAVAISSDAKSFDEEGVGEGWHMLGIIAFQDPLRPDTANTVKMCKELGVLVKMVTGDQKLIAKESCRQMELEAGCDLFEMKGGDYGGHKEVLAVEPDGHGQTHPLPTYEEASELRELAENFHDCTLGKEYGEMCEGAAGFAQVFPEHKYLIVSALQQKRYVTQEPVGMTGDGVNDAPALHRANIGIAVEGATEAAQAAADIVLTEPGLSAVVSAIVVSRKIFTRMKNFVVYRIACTLQLLFFFLIGCLAYNPKNYCADETFFFLPVSALVTIVILNDGTIISVAFDNVMASKLPESWNMPALWIVASVVGGAALLSSILLLDWTLQLSGNYEAARFEDYAQLYNNAFVNHSYYCNTTQPSYHVGYVDTKHHVNATQSCIYATNKLWTAATAACKIRDLSSYLQCNDVKVCTYHADNFLTDTGMHTAFGLDTLHYDEIKTLIYLKIALSDYLSLFNSRCHGWFFSRAPSYHVVLAAVVSTICSSLLAHWWPFGADMDGIPMSVVGFVWVYTLAWGVIQDACKVFTYWILNKAGLVEHGVAVDEIDIEARMKHGRERSHEVARLHKDREKKIVRYL